MNEPTYRVITAEELEPGTYVPGFGIADYIVLVENADERETYHVHFDGALGTVPFPPDEPIYVRREDR